MEDTEEKETHSFRLKVLLVKRGAYNHEIKKKDKNKQWVKIQRQKFESCNFPWYSRACKEVSSLMDFSVSSSKSWTKNTLLLLKKLNDIVSGATLGITDKVEAQPQGPSPHSIGRDPGWRS